VSYLSILLLLGHALGDFYLQPGCLVNRKQPSNPKWPRWVALHSLIYTAVLAALVALGGGASLWMLAWVPPLWLTHFLVDLFKSAYPSLAARLRRRFPGQKCPIRACHGFLRRWRFF